MIELTKVEALKIVQLNNAKERIENELQTLARGLEAKYQVSLAEYRFNPETGNLEALHGESS